ncbi:uncharacterized protein ACR2FA_007230 [Aphomia sociella]
MPTPEKNVLSNPEKLQDQPVREITQTDHLNKKLLTSLFNRMNEADNDGNSMLAKMLEPGPEEAEWEDEQEQDTAK